MHYQNHKEGLRAFWAEIKSALHYWKQYVWNPKFYWQLLKPNTEDINKYFPAESKKYLKYSLWISFPSFFFSVALYINLRANAQQIVNDPQANVQLQANLAQTTTIATSMKQSLEMMKKANEALSKVSNAVRDLESIKRIADDQKYMIKTTQDTYNVMKKSGRFSQKELGTMMMNFNRILDNALRLGTVATKIMQDQYLQMGDGERVKLMLELEATMNSQRRELQGISNNYYTLANKRHMFNFFRKPKF